MNAKENIYPMGAVARPNPRDFFMPKIMKEVEFLKGYVVREDGRLSKIKTGRVLKVTANTSGYLKFNAGRDKTMYLHRVIAIAFVSNPNNFSQVNHINGIKTDNRVENLEWVSRSNNIQHAYDTGLNYANGKAFHQIKDGKIIATFEKGKEVEKLGFWRSNVFDCCRGKRRQYKGFEWRFAKPDAFFSKDKRIVCQYSGDVLVNVFESRNAAKKYCKSMLLGSGGSIEQNLAGKTKNAYGFQWKYKSRIKSIEDETPQSKRKTELMKMIEDAKKELEEISGGKV